MLFRSGVAVSGELATSSMKRPTSSSRSPVAPETLAKTHWDGDTLVIEKRQEIGPGGSSWVSRYTLSQDGKTLAVTNNVNRSSLSAAFDESLTYEKQQ